MAINIIEKSLFPEYEIGNNSTNIKVKNKYKERWQQKKNSYFGLENCSNAIFNGTYEIPIIKSYKGTLPDKFITFSEIGKIGSPNIGVCCCDYD